jgi:hypothetical protein
MPSLPAQPHAPRSRQPPTPRSHTANPYNPPQQTSHPRRYRSVPTTPPDRLGSHQHGHAPTHPLPYPHTRTCTGHDAHPNHLRLPPRPPLELRPSIHGHHTVLCLSRQEVSLTTSTPAAPPLRYLPPNAQRWGDRRLARCRASAPKRLDKARRSYSFGGRRSFVLTSSCLRESSESLSMRSTQHT